MNKRYLQQLFPISLTIITFLVLSYLLYAYILFLDITPIHQKILPHLHVEDMVIGFTIYIKTAIDFAIFIGNLMNTYPGIKNRISIEIGTSLGNFIGTLFILSVWVFFKEIPLLLIGMIILSALVLLGMAEDGLSDFYTTNISLPSFAKLLQYVFFGLRHFNTVFSSFIRLILPKKTISTKQQKTHMNIFFYSITIPLVLGLDDFAGYIPLFTIVNVFGFAVGVFFGHMLLTASLFASPHSTTRIVRSPVVLLLGSLAFIGIALWGFYEVLLLCSKLIAW